MTNQRVWYAAFGSNLSYDRFLVYLNGGQAKGSTGTSPGARDRTPPPRSTTMFTPRRLAFGGAAERWSGGGVAFLETEVGEFETALRLYDVTLEQFEDVFRQESGLDEVVSFELDRLITDGLLDLTDRWYGRILYLGEHDGSPILSFTAAEIPAVRAPHTSYLQTIVRGLESQVDEHGFPFADRSAVRSYLGAAQGMQHFLPELWERVI